MSEKPDTLLFPDGGEQVPNKFQQAKEAARDDPTRTELTNMLLDLSHVHEILVDGEDEDWRPTEITVGFDDKGYHSTGAVIEIMKLAGWTPNYVVFHPYNRITFELIEGES